MPRFAGIQAGQPRLTTTGRAVGVTTSQNNAKAQYDSVCTTSVLLYPQTYHLLSGGPVSAVSEERAVSRVDVDIRIALGK